MKNNNVIYKCQEKGYQIFRDSPQNYQLNIVGVRQSQTKNRHFSDELHVFWWHRKEFQCIVFEDFTTIAGYDYLNNLGTPKGQAILKGGQYLGVWQIGLHRGQYSALVQRLGEVQVYRHNDKNEIWHKKPNTQLSGMFDINIHRVSRLDSILVGQWAASCQVFAKKSDFNLFMKLCQNARKNFGNRFSYTLLDCTE